MTSRCCHEWNLLFFNVCSDFFFKIQYSWKTSWRVLSDLFYILMWRDQVRLIQEASTEACEGRNRVLIPPTHQPPGSGPGPGIGITTSLWLRSLKTRWTPANQASLQSLNWKSSSQQVYLSWTKKGGFAGSGTVQLRLHLDPVQTHEPNTGPCGDHEK